MASRTTVPVPSTAAAVQAALRHAADPKDAVFLQRFFKTGKGQYGEGDVFIGVRVPATRAVVKEHRALPLPEAQKLLDSEVHEDRLAALMILAGRFAKSSDDEREKIFALYLRNVRRGRINNWDLVDSSAEYVIGAGLLDKKRDLLIELVQSRKLWERRVGIISSFAFIKKGDATTTLQLAKLLLRDKEDLIHKATGWMLREVGKRCDRKSLLAFLDAHAHEMPRTMLRYSLEHVTPPERERYMKQKARCV